MTPTGAGLADTSLRFRPPGVGEVQLHRLVFADFAGSGPAWAAALSEPERARAARLATPALVERFVLAHGFARAVLARALGVEPASIAILTDDRGKPALAPTTNAGRAPLGFNLAHSATQAVVALSPVAAIGVDVEDLHPELEITGIAERFFAPAEAKALAGLDPEVRAKAFLTLWTAKEAFVKAIGLGLSYGLDRFRIDGLERGLPRLVGLEPTYGPDAAWTLALLSPSPTSRIAVAVRDPGAVVERIEAADWLSPDRPALGLRPTGEAAS